MYKSIAAALLVAYETSSLASASDLLASDVGALANHVMVDTEAVYVPVSVDETEPKTSSTSAASGTFQEVQVVDDEGNSWYASMAARASQNDLHEDFTI